MRAPLIGNPYKPWNKDNSNYNKRGNDLKTSMDKIAASDPKLRALADQIIDLAVPRGKQKALNAKDALQKEGWRKWMDTHRTYTSKLKQLKQNASIAGHFIDLNEFNDQREHINDCYEEYLRMAQLGGRSKTTSVVENGQTVGKQVMDMTFEDYLKDCIRNLRWRLAEDLPKLKERENRGLIGIHDKEAENTEQMLKISLEFIKKFLELPSKQRFIYV